MIESQMILLKLADILSRARLDESTAKYVLRNDYLADMPRAGKQGRHREFTLDQAIRLSICTELVGWGVPLVNAAKALDYCIKIFNAWPRPRTAGPRYLFDDAQGFIIEVVDHAFLTLDRKGAELADYHLAMGAWFSLALGKVVHEEPGHELGVAEIMATAIARRLARPT